MSVGGPQRVGDPGSSEPLSIALGIDAPRRREVLKVPQLGAQAGCLQRIEAEIAADERVVVGPGLAVVTRAAQALGEVVVVRAQEPAFADAAEVLGREGREAAAQPERAGGLAVDAGADGLRGVLDHRHAALRAERRDLGDAVPRAVEVDEDDRRDPGVGVECAAQRVDVEVAPSRFDVDEDRLGAESGDDACGGEERVDRHRDPVTGPDAQRDQRGQQCVGARGRTDHVAGPKVGRHFGLERLHLVAEDVAPAAQHAQRGALELVLEGGVLSGEVEQRDGHGAGL